VSDNASDPQLYNQSIDFANVWYTTIVFTGIKLRGRLKSFSVGLIK
jgi:hypothetical protein